MYSILPVLCMYCTVYIVNNPQLNQQVGTNNNMNINNGLLSQDSLKSKIFLVEDSLHHNPIQEFRIVIPSHRN